VEIGLATGFQWIPLEFRLAGNNSHWLSMPNSADHCRLHCRVYYWERSGYRTKLGSCCFLSPFLPDLYRFLTIFTANVGTEGADENFLFWDVSKELSVTQPVLLEFG
jgi:hypothetical protein